DAAGRRLHAAAHAEGASLDRRGGGGEVRRGGSSVLPGQPEPVLRSLRPDLLEPPPVVRDDRGCPWRHREHAVLRVRRLEARYGAETKHDRNAAETDRKPRPSPGLHHGPP